MAREMVLTAPPYWLKLAEFTTFSSLLVSDTSLRMALDSACRRSLSALLLLLMAAMAWDSAGKSGAWRMRCSRWSSAARPPSWRLKR